MSITEYIGQLLAGIAIFLLGMSFMEETLHALGNRTFKLFLRRQTSSKLKAIGGGAVVTGILQSSSVVNLFILSLVGSGIIPLQNALAVMLGSNLGTTIDSWVVATLGFKFNISIVVYPLAGIAGISLAFFSSHNRFYHWCKFFLGFSFLFIGLGFIKTGMEDIVTEVDITGFHKWPLVAFFISGVLLTAIIQSSSATIALTLSALYSNAIGLTSAMAIVLGSEIGTTLKLFLASAKGTSVKRQLALGNFLVNTTIGLLVLSCLGWFQNFTSLVTGDHDKLLSLVFFQSLVNVTSILLFAPFLDRFSVFLSSRFDKKEEREFIAGVSPQETTLAGEALEQECRHFLRHVLAMGFDAFAGLESAAFRIRNTGFTLCSTAEKYQYIKNYYGELHGFYILLQAAYTNEPGIERSAQLSSAIRNGMYAAKNLKDVLQDIAQLKNSSNDTKYRYYLQVREQAITFSKEAMSILAQEHPNARIATIRLLNLYHTVQESYSREVRQLYQNKDIAALSDIEISTLLNFNREIFTYYKSMIFAIKDVVLDEKQAEQFDELPGFIR